MSRARAALPWLLALAFTARWWLPWLRGSGRRRTRTESPIDEQAIQLPETLPPDILASARQLWQQGKPRHALALLYRASVAAMAARIDAVLVPGATEAECLRAARGMADADDRDAFAQVVRVWQYAAYAERLPDDAGFDALASRLAARFAWGTPA